MDTSKVYRIRTSVGNDAPNVIQVPLNQTYDMFEILSLKLNQTNSYKTYESSYGVIVGRVIANGGFGIENARVSVFIPVSDDDSLKDKLLYNFTSVNGRDDKGIRYNLLPDYVDDACHQNVGTFPNKRLVLDNDDVVEMFDKYWKYTTRTNHSGDYMIFGVPVGSVQLHCDVDLSDCGILSQRPRDMINKGYNATMFESPNKFKSSTNLNSLAQIVTQDRGVYVYPYWGDISDGDDKFGITRCDINIEYKFESYAVFIGSIVTDKGSNAIGKNCTGTDNNGKMSDLIAGEGTIEMIRKTLDGKVEEFPIMGNRLIDGDGVWCYAIPMNLDYVTTDEFGNLVPTDNPDKGIATRTRVRFRISLDENPNDATARKRAKYLVPNNPRMDDGKFDETLKSYYEFGSATREENYCDMFWNKVYTVKNYIPKLQKNSKETNRKHTGIKLINHYGDNNPMPYNALTIKLGFTYRLICVITKIIINLIEFLNEIISIIGGILCLIIWALYLPLQIFDLCFPKLPFVGRICPFKLLGLHKLWKVLVSPAVKLIELIMPSCIGLSSEFCDDNVNQVTYYPGCGYFLFRLFRIPHGFINLDCVLEKTYNNHKENQLKICENEQKTPEDCEMSLTEPTNSTAMLYNCVENQLAQQNDAISFNFNNDWVNGVLYAPLWYRKITPKKRFFFGLFKRKAKDEWCSSERYYPGTRIIQNCTLPRENDGTIKNFDFKRVKGNKCDGDCHKRYTEVKGLKGVILTKETMLGQTVYYYKAVEYDATLPSNNKSNRGEIKLLFATDIVLLGSLNECDMNGIPQFFKTLESTTYNLPTDILFTDYDFIMTVNKDGTNGRVEYSVTDLVKTSEMAGCDWGNPNEFGKSDGGLFYSIGCTSGSIKLNTKSCINLARICEYGVSLDETKEVANLAELQDADDDVINGDNSSRYFDKLITDGFISWDELYNVDERSMFATMNGNKLKTKLNIKNGLQEYDFRYLYPVNFDGSLKEIMYNHTKRYSSEINYKMNYRLENPSKDYYLFRMGNNPYYYDSESSFPRYENSFYFYFGLKAGKTAIEKFNSKYFAECNNSDTIQTQIGINSKGNSWCSKIGYEQEDKDKGYNTNNDGYLALNLTDISTPYNLLIKGESNKDSSIEVSNITDEKIILINNGYKIPENFQEYVRLKDINGNTVPMINNGSYIGVITDNNGNITEFRFKISGQYLTFKTNVQSFEQPNNVLWQRFQNSYAKISSNRDGLNYKDINNVQREIGGVVTIYDIFNENNTIDFYSIDVRPLETIEGYDGVSIIYYNGSVYIWEDNKPKNIVDKNETHDITNNNNTLIWHDGKHHYAFGLPKGKVTYSITISQLCGEKLIGGVTSGNTVSNNIFVDEPIPYKMYINNIDYDVIKSFDNYTGWDIKKEGSISSPKLSEGSLDMTNPWFRVDNIYYKDIFKNFIKFNVTKDDKNNSFEIKGINDNDVESSFAVNDLIQEFCFNSKEKSVVPYNWVDDYIVSGYEGVKWEGSERTKEEENEAYDKIDYFIKDVNSVMQKRRELVSLMKETFFLFCEGDSKDITVRGQTNKLPCTQTIVYHKEKAVEFENYNKLDGSNLINEDSGQITDIRIPTISYHSSLSFGDGGDDTPCLAQVNNIKKKPYSVGIMNNSGVSIPTENDGNSFSTTLKNGVKYINHSKTKLVDLFNFPIIDNILKLEHIVWSAFVNIPQYGYDNGLPRKKAVTMNGILAGIVYNGNVINDNFSVQTLNNITLKLSKNITDKKITYVEKHVINGFNVDELGEWVISFLRSLVSVNVNEQILNYINVLFDYEFSIDDIYNIVNSLSVENGKLIYNIDGTVIAYIDIEQKLNKILAFTNYITLNNSIVQGTIQYVFILPTQTQLILQDENGCGIIENIDGNLTVDLSNNSVNNCRDHAKVLEVETEYNSYYSIFKAGMNGEYYPLNKAKNNNIIWQITEEIYGLHSNDKPENLFSFQTKTEHLRNKGLVDTNFKSETLISNETEKEEYETTYGYGTNGLFTPMSSFNYPVFIVSETDNNIRALSPVYDYSNVVADVKYGILERGEVKETEKEDGTKEYNIEVIKDYKFGISINGNETEQFYLLNYNYTLSGTCKLDSVNKIEVKKETLSAPNQYIFTTITENLYVMIKNNYGSVLSQTFKNKKFKDNTEIVAYDYTGLKHICDIGNKPIETIWYSFIWNANVPEGVENIGIKVGENEFSLYEEDYYERGTPLNQVTIYEEYIPTSEKDNVEWVGWSENKPLAEGEKPINVWSSIIGSNGVNKCRVFYGNWKKIQQ